jgi:hypothetical protein
VMHHSWLEANFSQILVIWCPIRGSLERLR